MYYEKESSALNFIAGVAIGAILGATVALLTAPHSGKRMRRQIVRVVSDVKRSAGDEWGDVSGELRRAVRKGRHRVRR